MEITLTHYLVLSTVLFAIGLIGVMRRKNLLMLFFATEILLNAVNIALVAISHYHGDFTGQLFALLVFAIDAAELALGICLLVLSFSHHNKIVLVTRTTYKG